MYLVTGASGQLGRAVIDHLLTTYNVPANKIIAASRGVDRLADLKAKGIELRSSDFNDEVGLAKTFAGAKRMLLISTNALEPGARIKQHLNAISAAEKAGVEHVLYTSMPKPETSAVSFAPDHLGTERALAASNLKGWTVLRHSWYFENLLGSLPHALVSGAQYSSAGQGKIPYIARNDLARADAAALVSNDTAKKTYSLTGAREYSTEEIAALISKAVGKPFKVVPVPIEDLVRGMLAAGLPEPVARMVASFDVNAAQGGFEGMTGDYKALTGREPQSFEKWLEANLKAFAS